MSLKRWSVVAVTCIVITLILAGIKAMQISNAIAFAESFPEQSEAVQVATVKHAVWTPTVSAMGEVVALSSVELRNELSGKIVEVGFKPGATVKQGQLLLRLDVSEEQAQLNAAQAELKLAKIDLDRFKRLLKTNASSKDQYDRALAQYASAEANTQVLKAIINKKTLRAPFDATAGLHELELGQYLAEDTLITRLVGTQSDVWVDFNLPQQQAMLPLGTVITAQAKGLLANPLKGQVIARNALVASQSRNMRLRALLPNASTQLKPGAIVEVSIPIGAGQTVTTLPVSAIRHDNFGSFVYILKKDEQGNVRASKRKIKLLQEKQQQAIISEGVELGEQVAAIGSYKLRNGMLVTLKQQPKGSAHE